MSMSLFRVPKKKTKTLHPWPEAAASHAVLQFCAAVAAPCNDRSSPPFQRLNHENMQHPRLFRVLPECRPLNPVRDEDAQRLDLEAETDTARSPAIGGIDAD